jgi:hypothetical protein
MPIRAYMDNGMDPLHFQTGLRRAKMELLTTIKSGVGRYEDYNNWAGYSKEHFSFLRC